MLSTKSQKNALQDFLFLLSLSGFFLLFRLGHGSLASWDEAIYAAVAKEVLQSGEWFRLTLGGSLWFDKPPLCIWVTALFYKLFGVHEFSARLFSALCGIGTVIVTYFMGCKLLNRWTAFLGALVLLSSSHFIRFARFGMMDAPLTFFLSLALYFFWLGQEKNRYLIFSGIAVGLAVMAKGFAAFFIFPIIWVYCWWAGSLELLGRSSYWIGVMIAAMIALPWNLYEMIVHRAAFMNDVVKRHLFTRIFSSMDGHFGNFYYYVRVLVNKYHPWVLIGIFSAPFFLFKAIKERRPEIIFLSLWMFFIFTALTLIQTKLPWYLFPVYPALSLSVGYFLAKIFSENQRSFIRAMFLAIMALHIPYTQIFDQDYSRDIKGIAALVQKEVPSDTTVYLYNYHETPAVFFYIARKNAYLDDREAFVLAARREEKFFCLIHENNLKSLEDTLSNLGLSVKGSFEDLKLLTKAPHR